MQDMDFRARFKELRLENRVTQKQIADMLNMSKMAVSHWENGDSEPSIEQLKILAKFFNVTVDYLVGFSD